MHQKPPKNLLSDWMWFLPEFKNYLPILWIKSTNTICTVNQLGGVATGGINFAIISCKANAIGVATAAKSPALQALHLFSTEFGVQNHIVL